MLPSRNSHNGAPALGAGASPNASAQPESFSFRVVSRDDGPLPDSKGLDQRPEKQNSNYQCEEEGDDYEKFDKGQPSLSYPD